MYSLTFDGIDAAWSLAGRYSIKAGHYYDSLWKDPTTEVVRTLSIILVQRQFFSSGFGEITKICISPERRVASLFFLIGIQLATKALVECVVNRIFKHEEEVDAEWKKTNVVSNNAISFGIIYIISSCAVLALTNNRKIPLLEIAFSAVLIGSNIGLTHLVQCRKSAWGQDEVVRRARVWREGGEDRVTFCGKHLVTVDGDWKCGCTSS